MQEAVSQYFWFLLPLSFFNSTLADLLCKYQICARKIIFLLAFFSKTMYILICMVDARGSFDLSSDG